MKQGFFVYLYDQWWHENIWIMYFAVFNFNILNIHDNPGVRFYEPITLHRNRNQKCVHYNFRWHFQMIQVLGLICKVSRYIVSGNFKCLIETDKKVV